MHNYGMYVIAIGWLYVALMVAIAEPNPLAGMTTFLFTGLLPASLLLWLGGSKARRQRRRREEVGATAHSLTDQNPGQGDGGNTKADQ